MKPNEELTAEINVKHRFFNNTKERCKFLCTIKPGYRGFEQSLQIGYGLAQNGAMDKVGLPKNTLHLGYLVSLSDTWLTGWQSIFHFFISHWNKKAIEKGIDIKLKEKYVKY